MRMTDELLTLRAILLSGSQGDHDVFREAASRIKVPIDMVATDSVAAVSDGLIRGADLMFIDSGCSAADTARAVAAARGAAKPPFVILLVGQGGARVPQAADGVAAKPFGVEEAFRLIERTMRLRIPSRALVVDDSATMRSIVRKTLAATRFPFEVTEAAEGLTALKLVGERPFDVVFLDYNMPEFSGLETLAEFKRQQRRMTVVVITSADDDTLVDRVRAHGAAFLKKPFFPADIEAVLAAHYGLTALNPKRA
jgi:CheY-like chemotaxis protein